MAYDSAATRARLLDAAYVEFAERGLAGARVDRVATEAGANKQAIYAYFGSKDGLFDAVLERRLGVLADQVPFTPHAYGDYVLALFDHMVEHPELVRLTQWKLLERAETTDLEIASHLDKAAEVAAALGVDPGRGMDVFMLTLAMAQAWLTTSPSIRGAGQDVAGRLSRHREALVASVDATVAALS